MGSDDVRARAEAYRVAWRAAQMLSPDAPLPEFQRVRAERHAAREALFTALNGLPSLASARAALAAEPADASASPVDATAVAPATAQPVAWACRRRDGTFLTNDGGGIDTTDVADHVGWQRVADEAHPKDAPHTLAPLYAAPPATGDAAAVGIAGLDFHVPRDRTPSGYTRVEAYMGNGHVVVMGSPIDESHSCDALGCGSTGAHVIARLPLPAPATAKCAEEQAVHDALNREYKRAQEDFRRRMADVASEPLSRDLILRMPIHGRAATHAAKESRSDDRPASGQGGV